MAIWYEYSLAQTVIDLFIHTSIFAGRFDMRHLLSAKTHFDADIRGVEVGKLLLMMLWLWDCVIVPPVKIKHKSIAIPKFN